MTESTSNALANQVGATAQIVCPKCHESFALEDSGYANILKQVHDQEFQAELDRRIDAERKTNEANLEIARQELIISNNEAIAKSNEAIQLLQAKIDNSEIAKQLAVTTATQLIERERDAFASDLKVHEIKSTSKELELQTKLTDEIRNKDLEIASLKDYKLRKSTKGIGEDLEQFCETEFNKIRAVAFPKAEFGKDNLAKDGTKGDYIFREFSEEGVEIVSIMFEMKNENEETQQKQKNKDFYKKLDKDRNGKSCEYAVLVSALELDNDLFNEGIVDVSHEANKMFVVRPGFFIPIIALLRNAALNSLSSKQELALLKEQNVDVENFREKLDDYKKKFDRNIGFASTNISDAIVDIDKSIKSLQETREHLVKTSDYIDKAHKNLDDVSISKLTYRNTTMTKMFADEQRTITVSDDSPTTPELES
jgi:hypothetical protein